MSKELGRTESSSSRSSLSESQEPIDLPVTRSNTCGRMRGGAQGHLMRCSDGHFYVVKFRNNPQHLRVLANEMLATRLAERAGLPVPVTEVVEVG